MRFLVQVTCGPEDPTKAALGVLIARTAAEEGHEVTVFLVGDGVMLVRPGIIDALQGLGTGALRAHFDALVSLGARIVVSRLSAQARGMDDPTQVALPVEFGLPVDLVRLAADADRVMCY